MNSNKKIAALLWVLIPPKYRINIEKYLSKQEIEELKNTFKEYKKLSPEEKLKIQTMLHKVFYSSYKFLYFLLLLFILSFLGFFVYYILNFSFSPFFVFSLFWPYAMGILGILMLFTLQPYELYFLFRLSKNMFHYLISIVMFYLLVYLLFTINQIEKPNFNVYYPVEKWILTIGIISAPILEEIIFRYSIPNLFGRDFFRQVVGHYVSNLIFSVLHLPNFEQGILYFLCGMALSLLRIFTDRLIFCVMVHSLANLTIFYFL